MHSNGIIHSGLSGKKLTKSDVEPRLDPARSSPGVIGPPLITSTTSGR